ncbi:uncharacterized protein C17orf80 homolog [Xyrichtys novacula]|uniref:Uncharacterized protein C17orf80 homolog n=1 Tax=Xyrichtys novacula TaxID=13765 RepID=A0AAV1H5X2_XYRNO|nr:uncharacterized protein C17orf80 homolog [Xyrichtys novacula]
MSSEVCPFCGKTFKRLKSHLPHCKAAASSKTPPTKHDASANQTSFSSQLAAYSSEPKAEEKNSTQTLPVTSSQSKRSKKTSVVSAVPANPSSPSQQTSQTSVFPPATTKKKKPKLSERIKAAKTASSTSIISSPSLSPDISEPKKKSLRDLIQAAKPKQAPAEPVEGTRSAPEDLHLSSASNVTESRTRMKTETRTNLDKGTVKDSGFLSADSKLKGVSNRKARKAAESSLQTKGTSSSLNSKAKETAERLRDGFLFESEEEAADFSVNKMFSKSGSGHQARITLQDVKTTLGRANGARQTNRQSILSQIQTTDVSLNRPALSTGTQGSSVIRDETLSEQLHRQSPPQTELQSVRRKGVKSKQAALIPFKQDVSLQAVITSPEYLPQVNQATPPPPLPPTLSINKSSNKTGLLTISQTLVQFSSPHPHIYPARAETLRACNEATKGSLAERSLGQVRLRELPEWLVCKAPSHPRDVVEMVQRGWQWYYKRYIDVKKGGVGGVGMLLAGYCVLSYIWSYPHIKKDRWRRYH